MRDIDIGLALDGRLEVDPAHYQDLVLAVVELARQDALRNPRRWPDAAPFLADMARACLRRRGRDVGDDPPLEELRGIWQRSGGGSCPC